MQRSLLTLTLLAACGSAHAVSLCDDLHLATPPQHAYSTAPAAPPSAPLIVAMEYRVEATKYAASENTEKYAHQDINPVQRTADNPVSTFSIDIDTGSYSNVRRMIEKENRLPPADAVRIEEIGV